MFNPVRAIQQRWKKLNRRMNKVSLEQIKKDIANLPINKGDTVFVHSALSSLGYFDFDPERLIELLLDKVGTEGNLLMPGFPINGYTIDYLKANPVFDVQKTPSRMGMFTEKFRTKFKAERSLHPSHSVLAVGPLAKEITAEHHLSPNPFGTHSPFYKFLQLKNSKVLGLGTTIFPFTVFRVYESMNYESYPVQVFNEEKMDTEIIDRDGKRFFYTTFVHNPQASNLRRNMLFENYFIKKGMLKKYKTGRTDSYLLSAGEFLKEMEENYKQGNLPYLGHYRDFELNKVDQSRLFKKTDAEA
jgi:aminoglycoside 3-N-acetyltransferase